MAAVRRPSVRPWTNHAITSIQSVYNILYTMQSVGASVVGRLEAGIVAADAAVASDTMFINLPQRRFACQHLDNDKGGQRS
jgi:hypothetical protein